MIAQGDHVVRETWHLRMDTLTGERLLVLTIVREDDRWHGRLLGRPVPVPVPIASTAGGVRRPSVQREEPMPVLDLWRRGDRLGWWHRSSWPTALNYRVEAAVRGARMRGRWRAGWLPEGLLDGVLVATEHGPSVAASTAGTATDAVVEHSLSRRDWS